MMNIPRGRCKRLIAADEATDTMAGMTADKAAADLTVAVKII